jgi:hypothetical protein
MNDENAYEAVVRMLNERGIDRVAELLQPYQNDEDLNLVVGAIKWWDDLPKVGERAVGPGLLVKKIQQGGVEGYKRPGERQSPQGRLTLDDKKRQYVRSHAFVPDGVRRQQLAVTIARPADRINMTPDQMIDACVGPQWTETPPFPMQGPRDVTWEWPDAAEIVQSTRYMMWVHSNYEAGEVTWRADPMVVRRPGESDYDFAIRFWNYEESEEIRENLRKIVLQAREERAEKAKTPEPEAQEPAGQTEVASASAEPASVSTVVDAETQRLDEKWGDEAPW